MNSDSQTGPGEAPPPFEYPDAFWAVPLDEPPAAPQPPTSAPVDPRESEPPILLLFRAADTPPEVGFHPRLRRFDEAA